MKNKEEYSNTKEPKNKRSIILKKHSSVVEISNVITTVQRKTFNFLLKKAIDQYHSANGQQLYKFTVPIHDLVKYLDFNKNYEYLKKELKKLTHIAVEYNILNKDKQHEWGTFVLLAGVSFTEERGKIVFSFPHQIVNFIIDPKMYALLDLAVIRNLSNKYSIALYEFLMDYKNSPQIPAISIEKFRKIMGVDPKAYKSNFTVFRQRVIDSAVKELNSNDKIPFFVSYKFKRDSTTGRRYTHIKFTVTPKNALKDVNIPEDVLILVPEKERTKEVLSDIAKLVEKHGKENVQSALLYVSKHKYEDFLKYLHATLKNRYNAGVEEEVEKVVAKKKRKKQKEEEEKFIKETAAKVAKLIHTKEEFAIMAEKLIHLSLEENGISEDNPQFSVLIDRITTEVGNILASKI